MLTILRKTTLKQNYQTLCKLRNVSLQFEKSKEPAIKTEPEEGGDDDFDDEDDDDDDDDDDEMHPNEMCLEAKEVVQYTSDESSSDEDDFGEDIEDSDYGSRKGKESNLHY